MRQVRHPLVERDLVTLVDHIYDGTGGDVAAVERRLDEVDVLLREISHNPTSGTRLTGFLDGWLVRHGGHDRRITIVFRPDQEADLLHILMIAFGAQDWLRRGGERSVY